MKRIKVLVFSMLAAMMLASCGTTQKVPLTGRTHRISVSDAQVLSLSNQEYTKYMASAKKSTNAVKTAQEVRVGKRLLLPWKLISRRTDTPMICRTIPGNSTSFRTTV